MTLRLKRVLPCCAIALLAMVSLRAEAGTGKVPVRSVRSRHAVALQAVPARPKAPVAKRPQALFPKPQAKSSRGAAANEKKGAPPAKTRRRPRQDPSPEVELPTLHRAHGKRQARESGPASARVSMVTLRGRAREFVPVGPAPLRGSHDILVHQNLMADDEGLERIQDADDLERLRASRDLIDFPEGRTLHVNAELPADRRCARTWTVRFTEDTARAFYAKFGRPLELNSAARSVEYQARLQHTNGNAAGTDGEAASPHLTGQAIDLGKRGMSRAELAWMRARLLPLIQAGKIDVEEEFQQACFHISVYRSYLPVGRQMAGVRDAGSRE